MGDQPDRQEPVFQPNIRAHIDALQVLALTAPEITQTLLQHIALLARDVAGGPLPPHQEKALLQLLHLWAVIVRPTETMAPRKPPPARAALRLVEKRA